MERKTSLKMQKCCYGVRSYHFPFKRRMGLGTRLLGDPWLLRCRWRRLAALAATIGGLALQWGVNKVLAEKLKASSILQSAGMNLGALPWQAQSQEDLGADG